MRAMGGEILHWLAFNIAQNKSKAQKYDKSILDAWRQINLDAEYLSVLLFIKREDYRESLFKKFF